ncbi:hypothetical protein [Sphingobacterium sp. LRF_L2]|uniref:hypothetical protein n=1 Tax=Sphingobacterium sp. LRF_L2 TaxID=3369421 RepID=UPI003F61C851
MKSIDDKKLYQWVDQLRERGHTASKQRILIMQALFAHPIIEDIETFWITLRQEHRISWATFYSFIRLAVKEKWLAKQGPSSTYARYHLLIDTQ